MQGAKARAAAAHEPADVRRLRGAVCPAFFRTPSFRALDFQTPAGATVRTPRRCCASATNCAPALRRIGEAGAMARRGAAS